MLTDDEIRAALAQQGEQQPVAYGMADTQLGRGYRLMMVRLDKGQDGCTIPLYTAAPAAQQWKPVGWIGTNPRTGNVELCAHTPSPSVIRDLKMQRIYTGAAPAAQPIPLAATCHCACVVKDDRLVELCKVHGKLAAPAAQPLTDAQIMDEYIVTPGIHQFIQAFREGARFAERAHGIRGARAQHGETQPVAWRLRDTIDALRSQVEYLSKIVEDQANLLAQQEDTNGQP